MSPEINHHSIANRKRLRKDFREGSSIKPSADHLASQPVENNGPFKIGTKLTQWESPKGLKYLARPSERLVKQGRVKRPASSNLEESCPEVSRTRGIKCQRQTTSADSIYADKVTSKLAQAPSCVLGSPQANVLADPTHPLGVGWSPLSSDPDTQAAVRGWVKFIENHFPITDVKILLQSKGLACTLVEAAEGYFLFGDDLKQGRLISKKLEKLRANLQGPTPIFESETVLRADINSRAGIQRDSGVTMSWTGSAHESNCDPSIDTNEFSTGSISGLEVKMDMC